jgi:hypothetical protein
LRWTLVVALAAHAAAAVWAAHVKPPAVALEAPEAPFDVTETAIDVEPAPAEPLATAAESPAAAGASSPQTRGVESSRDRTGQAGPSAEVAPTGPVASAGASAPDGTWTFDPTGKAPPAGSGSAGALPDGAIASAVGTGVGPIVREYAQKRQAFEKKHAALPMYSARDIELGMTPGGVLVSLTRDLVRRSLAPDNGRALLQFDTDGKGVIASVRVLDVSSERAEWVRVADDILAASHGTTLHVPDGASGVALTLEVTSAMKTVDGVSAGEKSAFAKALRAINDPTGTIMDGATHPQRVVATRIVDVQAF